MADDAVYKYILETRVVNNQCEIVYSQLEELSKPDLKVARIIPDEFVTLFYNSS